MNPKGHAALITGGGSGLGAATAEALAAAGAKVAILDLNMDAAKNVAAKTGGLAIRCDVSHADATQAAIKEAHDKHGPARIVVNCAGIGEAKRIVGREGPMPLAEFERTIRINLIGTFNTMRLAAADMQGLPALEAGERGIIVMTASVAAFEGQIGQAAYSASKGGIVALVLPAARELAQFGIRVNAIAPGIFRTPMLGALREDFQKSLAEFGAVPQAAGRSLRVRGARHAYGREPLPQRRDRAARRRAAHGAALTMLTNSRRVTIEWQHCDPAGIVFYPRYFAMFDTSTTMLFEKALGMTKYQLLKKYDFLGYPMVDTHTPIHAADAVRRRGRDQDHPDRGQALELHGRASHSQGRRTRCRRPRYQGVGRARSR